MGSQGWERLQEGMVVGGIVEEGMVGVQGRAVLVVGLNREAAVVAEGSPTFSYCLSNVKMTSQFVVDP